MSNMCSPVLGGFRCVGCFLTLLFQVLEIFVGTSSNEILTQHGVAMLLTMVKPKVLQSLKSPTSKSFALSNSKGCLRYGRRVKQGFIKTKSLGRRGGRDVGEREDQGGAQVYEAYEVKKKGGTSRCLLLRKKNFFVYL